jgi:hypothetical protein
VWSGSSGRVPDYQIAPLLRYNLLKYNEDIIIILIKIQLLLRYNSHVTALIREEF